MSLWLRFFFVGLCAFWRKPLRVAEDASQLKLRVLPNDLDLNFHMNNGRYLTIMDLGRLDLAIRIGLGKKMLRHGWHPVIGGAAIQFRRPLSLGQSYQLHTKVVCWDHKWVYFEQRFVVDGDAVAIAMVKGLFRHGKANIPTQEVANILEPNLVSPPMPEAMREWVLSEKGWR